MRSAVVVYNPAAGRFPVEPFIQSVVEELESGGWQVEAAATRSGPHTTELAKQAAAENKDAVFAVGGDGTIGNVVNGLIGSETALGVLPAGTANVWSIELGLTPFAWTRTWVLRKQQASMPFQVSQFVGGLGRDIEQQGFQNALALLAGKAGALGQAGQGIGAGLQGIAGGIYQPTVGPSKFENLVKTAAPIAGSMFGGPMGGALASKMVG